MDRRIVTSGGIVLALSALLAPALAAATADAGQAAAAAPARDPICPTPSGIGRDGARTTTYLLCVDAPTPHRRGLPTLADLSCEWEYDTDATWSNEPAPGWHPVGVDLVYLDQEAAAGCAEPSPAGS